MISFENTEVAFKSKSNKELKKAYWLFRIVGNPGMVKFGKWATKFAINTHLPINGLIKRTIFQQFCGGVSITDSLKTSQVLAERNVMTILDYSIEGKTSEEDFDRTVEEIIGTIHEAKKNPNIPFAVFKVTGICRFEILEKANRSTDDLDEQQLSYYNKLRERIDRICKEAYEGNVPLFIDAEESWIQDTIDRLVYEMSVKYNKERAIVYNTVQMYRHDRLQFIKNEFERAEKEGWYIGLKIVRGAYMEKERERAADNNYPSPIQQNKISTDSDFNEALKFCIDRLDRISICAGTHNESSSLLLTELISKKNIAKNDKRVYFAQLLGMSDHISFNLADADFNVAKYVPYGPIKEVLPYLIRRAEENTSVAGQTSRELSLIMKEISRRKSA